MNQNQIKFLALNRHHRDTSSQILKGGEATEHMIQLLPQINAKKKETKNG